MRSISARLPFWGSRAPNAPLLSRCVCGGFCPLSIIPLWGSGASGPFPLCGCLPWSPTELCSVGPFPSFCASFFFLSRPFLPHPFFSAALSAPPLWLVCLLSSQSQPQIGRPLASSSGGNGYSGLPWWLSFAVTATPLPLCPLEVFRLMAIFISFNPMRSQASRLPKAHL